MLTSLVKRISSVIDFLAHGQILVLWSFENVWWALMLMSLITPNSSCIYTKDCCQKFLDFSFEVQKGVLHTCIWQASSEEGAKRVYQLLQNKMIRTLGWQTLFNSLVVYEQRFRQCLQTAGAFLPPFQEGDARALEAYLKVLMRVWDTCLLLLSFLVESFLLEEHIQKSSLFSVFTAVRSVDDWLCQ